MADSTIVYDLLYSVDNSEEEYNLIDILQTNGGVLTVDDLMSLLSLKVGEIFPGGLSADIKRLEDRIDS